MGQRQRGESGVSTTTAALVGVVAVLLVVIGVFAGLLALTTDTSIPAESSDQPTTDGATIDASQAGSTPDVDPSLWLEEASKAAKDGYPAFVPAELPQGWLPGLAAYVTGVSWRFELVSQDGQPTVVDQRDVKVATMLDDALTNPTEGGTLNLKRWGTGTWQEWTGDDDRYAVVKKLASTTVVVSGEKSDVQELAKTLLTAEFAVGGNEG